MVRSAQSQNTEGVGTQDWRFGSQDSKYLRINISTSETIWGENLGMATRIHAENGCWDGNGGWWMCQDLHTIHSGFHSDLVKACSNRHNTFTTSSNALTISDCFVKWKEKFLKYGEYCSNLPRVQTLLDRLVHNQSANQAITVLYYVVSCDGCQSFVARSNSSRMGRVCTAARLFFQTISWKSMQLWSPDLTYECSTMSPGNPLILGSEFKVTTYASVFRQHVLHMVKHGISTIPLLTLKTYSVMHPAK